MVNIGKIKVLAKSKGISITFICEKFGVGRGYLNDVARGRNTMSEERVAETAVLLGTSFEYLMDITDDPSPDFLRNLAMSTREKLNREITEKARTITASQAETIKALLELPPDKRQRVLDAVRLMIE